jgi:hypothetical protein
MQLNHFKRTAYLLFAILFGVVFSCDAQRKSKRYSKTAKSKSSSYRYKKRSPEEKARYFTGKMVDSLNVTKPQEDSLFIMNIEVSKKFDSVRAIVDDMNREDRSAAYRSIYAYRDSCMREILPRKEFLKFLDIEREKWERKKAKQREKGKSKEE